MTCEAMTETLRRLDAEWNCLSEAAGLVGSLAAVRNDPDAALLALLRRHAAGDGLAGRVVLQALLPKMVRMASRDAAADLSDYLAALWERICTYPVAQRPRRVAANLALDTLKLVKARTRGVDSFGWAAPQGPEGWDAEDLLEAGERLGYIDATTRRTLRVVYVDGRSSRAAASELGMSSDSVRWRCSKGVRALRAHALDLAEELAG